MGFERGKIPIVTKLIGIDHSNQGFYLTCIKSLKISEINYFLERRGKLFHLKIGSFI